MIILAIDSTMSGCSACLYDDLKGEIASKTLAMTRGQAEQLIPMIDNVMEKSEFFYNDLDLIAVTKGPGAFTGMRIGLATAKSLGLVIGIPVFGVSTFHAVLETYLSDPNSKIYPYYSVLLETKRSDYYFQMFDGKTQQPFIEPMVASPKDIIEIIDNKDCIILGDAFDRFKSDIASVFPDYALPLSSHISMPSPSSIAKIAMIDYNKGAPIGCSPTYLRLPEIGTPKNKTRNLK